MEVEGAPDPVPAAPEDGVEHQQQPGRDREEPLVARAAGQEAPGVVAGVEPARSRPPRRGSARAARPRRPTRKLPHASSSSAPSSCTVLCAAVRAQAIAGGPGVVRGGAGVAHHAPRPAAGLEREQVGVRVAELVVGAVRARAHHHVRRRPRAARPGRSRAPARRAEASVAVPASASRRRGVDLAVPGVAEQRELAVVGQQVREEAGHAGDRVAEPGGRALAEQRAHLEQILERDRVIVRRALVVAAVREHLLRELRPRASAARLGHDARELVREDEPDGVAQQVVRAHVPLEVLAQEEAVERDRARDEAPVRRESAVEAEHAPRRAPSSRAASRPRARSSCPCAKSGRPIVASRAPAPHQLEAALAVARIAARARRPGEIDGVGELVEQRLPEPRARVERRDRTRRRARRSCARARGSVKRPASAASATAREASRVREALAERRDAGEPGVIESRRAQRWRRALHSRVHGAAALLPPRAPQREARAVPELRRLEVARGAEPAREGHPTLGSLPRGARAVYSKADVPQSCNLWRSSRGSLG